jgi:hypothetical protein
MFDDSGSMAKMPRYRSFIRAAASHPDCHRAARILAAMAPCPRPIRVMTRWGSTDETSDALN